MSLAGDYIDIKGAYHATHGGIDSGATAAGGAVYGAQVDLQPTSGYRYRRCMAWGSAKTYHKAATQSISLAIALQHRSATTGAGSTWAKYATASDPTAKSVTATASGTTQNSNQGYWDLRSANRYLRVKLTFDPSTTATGLIYHETGGIILADINRLPTTG